MKGKIFLNLKLNLLDNEFLFTCDDFYTFGIIDLKKIKKV